MKKGQFALLIALIVLCAGGIFGYVYFRLDKMENNKTEEKQQENNKSGEKQEESNANNSIIGYWYLGDYNSISSNYYIFNDNNTGEHAELGGIDLFTYSIEDNVLKIYFSNESETFNFSIKNNELALKNNDGFTKIYKKNELQNNKSNNNKNENVMSKIESLILPVAIIEQDYTNYLYNEKYICSTHGGACANNLYQSVTVNSSDLNIKYKILNTMRFLLKYKPDAFLQEEGNVLYGNNLGYTSKLNYISVSNLKGYIEKFYNLKLDDDYYKGITHLRYIGVDSMEGADIITYKGQYYVVDTGTGNLNVKEEVEKTAQNKRIEKKDEYIYYYTSVINNLHCHYEYCYIGEMIEKNKITEEITYEKYKSYYNDWKLTFKDNNDGTYTFISSEPLK